VAVLAVPGEPPPSPSALYPRAPGKSAVDSSGFANLHLAAPDARRLLSLPDNSETLGYASGTEMMHAPHVTAGAAAMAPQGMPAGTALIYPNDGSPPILVSAHQAAALAAHPAAATSLPALPDDLQHPWSLGTSTAAAALYAGVLPTTPGGAPYWPVLPQYEPQAPAPSAFLPPIPPPLLAPARPSSPTKTSHRTHSNGAGVVAGSRSRNGAAATSTLAAMASSRARHTDGRNAIGVRTCTPYFTACSCSQF
jgi:hypothetical protein